MFTLNLINLIIKNVYSLFHNHNNPALAKLKNKSTNEITAVTAVTPESESAPEFEPALESAPEFEPALESALEFEPAPESAPEPAPESESAPESVTSLACSTLQYTAEFSNETAVHCSILKESQMRLMSLI